MARGTRHCTRVARIRSSSESGYYAPSSVFGCFGTSESEFPLSQVRLYADGLRALANACKAMAYNYLDRIIRYNLCQREQGWVQ
eukprot:9137937-Pyramimonas_sp.AAC.1